MKKQLIGLAVSGFILGGVVNANANLITNGSFEGFTGDTNIHNGAVAPDWTQVSGTPDIFDANTNFDGYEWGASGDGGDFLHSLYNINIYGIEWIETVEQVVAGLTIGKQYELSFEQSISRSDRSEVGGFWGITFGAETYNSDSMVFPGYSDGFTGWHDQIMTFTATAVTQTLSISAWNITNDGKRTDLGLDGLSLDVIGESTPTPEPATMLLFGTGLAGLVGSKIRRKKK